MEPTTRLIIGLLIAYTPFILYWVSVIRVQTKITDADKRKHKRKLQHYWGEE